jgi:hypothetical protein
MEKGATDLDKRERILSFVAAPWWQGPKIHIASNDEAARYQHDKIVQDKGSVYVYTDGSCIGGHTGSAVI